MPRDQVEATWSRIVAWLRAHAPSSHATLLPPAANAANDIEEHVGSPLGDELRSYFDIVGGCERSSAGAIFPQGRPLTAAAVQEQSSMRRQVYDDLDRDDPSMRAESMRREAGDMSWSWLTHFVPLCEDFGGDGLFVDLRPGPQRGCIKQWDHQQGALYPPLWSGVVEMLEDIASTLESSGECHGWRPQVRGGTLQWEFPPPTAPQRTWTDDVPAELVERLFPSGRDLPVAEPDELDLRYLERMRSLGSEATPRVDGPE